MEFSLGAVPMRPPGSSASLASEEGGRSSPPPFAEESSRQRSAATAERIRKASAPSSVRPQLKPCQPLCMLWRSIAIRCAVHSALCRRCSKLLCADHARHALIRRSVM